MYSLLAHALLIFAFTFKSIVGQFARTGGDLFVQDTLCMPGVRKSFHLLPSLA